MVEEKEVIKNWKLTKISEVAESIQYGYTESSSKEPVGPKFLRITDIQDSSVNWDNVQYCKIDEETKKKYLLKEGDLVFARTGATVGKSFLIKGKFPEAVYASYLIRLRFKNGVSEKYIYNFFQSPFYWKQITEGQVGIGQPNVNGTKLGQLEFPYAPYEEQISTALKIEELFSELDKGIEQLKSAQQQLKVYRQSVLKWAFEGRLTNENVQDGELPKGWKWVKNKELLKYVTSGSRDWKKFYSLKGALFVRTQDINTNKLDFKNAAYVDLPPRVEGKRSLVEKGDLLMTITGANVGKVAFIDFPIEEAYVSQSVALLKYQDKQIVKFLWYYFQTSGFGKTLIENLVYGMGRPVLSLENMREVDVLLCSLDEQQRIIQEIESRLSVADKLEETINNSLQQAEALRQSILKKSV